jgi:phage tail sheath protein FI
MAGPYRTPGAYIEEISRFPPSVAPVETAIPAFLGYTRNTQYQGENLINAPKRITSLLEFEQVFGTAPAIGGFAVTVDPDGAVLAGVSDPRTMAGTTGVNARHTLHYALRHFYLCGGGDCYVISCGGHADRTPAQIASTHIEGLDALALEDEPTLIVMPDLSMITPVDDTNRATYHSVLVQALAQCGELGDRFLIGDILGGDQAGQIQIDAFRNGIGTANLKYGAIYHPYIRTTLPWLWDESTITVSQLSFRNDDGEIAPPPSPWNGLTLEQLHEGPSANPLMYATIRGALDRQTVMLPPSPAVAGVYSTTDRTRGVFKAPGNASVAAVRSLTVAIDNDLNDHMNVHPTGKSVNAIRAFAGRGVLVWGARTLDGNSNEWRYVNVRRFFNFVEESTKKASFPFVFAANNANTWARVKGMIENFLTNQWRDGALAGATSEDAFYVRVGLGTTMTAQDVLEGRMNVEIGMAVVRPAEFIILRFSHKLPTE